MDINSYAEMGRILCVDPQHMQHVEIRNLPDEKLAVVEPTTITRLCYNNSLVASRLLNGEALVFGVALTCFEGTWLPAEHCWVKLQDGTEVDPTYQVLQNERKTKREILYFKLFEITLPSLRDVQESLGKSSLAGLEMRWFRKSEHYRHCFLG
ncbi:hypothetical protein J4N45_10615 [Vibrio sp. SCSIO 43140]|uniref:hypothetical protein n=1 Tax=Vibrio sp. SCSIO 43140 TaxID=2819100 RepID=UPI002074F443|nr:hypothetical protein [Vibrio sp. SCSIO 43140]USD58983.1 hypothetical protein J4N45_10615 [Vibrio sp. SCSIO 43140]